DERHQEGAEDAQDRAECGADQPLEADLLQADFEKDDGKAQEQTACPGDDRAGLKWVQRRGRTRKNQDENSAYNDQVEQKTPPFRVTTPYENCAKSIPSPVFARVAIAHSPYWGSDAPRSCRFRSGNPENEHQTSRDLKGMFFVSSQLPHGCRFAQAILRNGGSAWPSVSPPS